MRHDALLVCVTLALGSAGCFMESPDDVATGDRAIEECPEWLCNTAFINGHAASELNHNGLISDAGFRIRYIEIPAGAYAGTYDLKVMDGEFHAVDGGGNTVAGGADLVNATIHLEHTDGSAYELYIIDRRGDLPYWGSVPGTMPAYHITFGWNGLGENDICKAPTDELNEWDGFHTYALLIQGERYDHVGKTIYDDEDGGWFHITCTGSALSKMMRLGYNPATPDTSPYATTREQRQATLKMITADYCGTGRSFTRDGTPLRWQNAGAWHIPVAPGARESIWTAEGALCLDSPRLRYDDPDLLTEIEAECGGSLPPPCNWVPGGGWPAGAEWHTFLPL